MRIAVLARGDGAGERLDLLGRVEVQAGALGLGAAVGSGRRVAREPERRLVARVVEDRADELARLVDRARRDAARGLLGEHRVDLAGRDLVGGPVAECVHDEPAVLAAPAAVGRAGLDQQVAVLTQRRGLRAADLLEPVEVRVGDHAERRRRVRLAPSRVGALGQRAFDLAHDAVLRDDRGVLVEEARPDPAAAPRERAVGGRLQPRGPEPALHRAQRPVGFAMAPAGLVDGRPVARGGDQEPRGRNVVKRVDREHAAATIAQRSSAGVARLAE